MDYYQVLGLQRSATEAEIKSAYRRLAFANHPDRNPGDQNAVIRFKEIQKAYDALMDKNTRVMYSGGFTHEPPKPPTGKAGKPKPPPGWRSTVVRDGFDITDAPPPLTDLWGRPLDAYERAEWARNNATDIMKMSKDKYQGWKDSQAGKYTGGSPELR
jgi:DnaJ-class molecular chaperone